MTNGVRFGARASAVQRAWVDVVDGVKMYPVWSAFGLQDIRQRYQRSVLGPFWITIAMMVTILGVGPLYSALLHIDANSFIPFLAMGLIAWSLISGVTLEGCEAFSASESMIRSVRLPMTQYVLRVIFRNVLMFFHNTLAFVPFAIYLGIRPHWDWLVALPGVALIVVASFPAAVMLGIFCTRFRDMKQIVASVVQLSFFLTPIFWKPELLGSRIAFATDNPFFLFLEVVRGPIMGTPPGPEIYAKVAFITVVLYALAVPVFVRYRSRIAFWV